MRKNGNFHVDFVNLPHHSCFLSQMWQCSYRWSYCRLSPRFVIACISWNYSILEADTISKHGELPIADCNANCDCSGVYQPLCYDDMTFVNPCLAGCQMSQNGSFGDCACLDTADPSSLIPTGVLSSENAGFLLYFRSLRKELFSHDGALPRFCFYRHLRHC